MIFHRFTEYAYIYFALIFRDGSCREYLIIKFNRPKSATYILSSVPRHLKHFKSIAEELLKIFDGKHKHFTGFKHYSRYLMRKFGICFHRVVKRKKNENIEDWLKRFKERILEYDKCKGIRS